MHPEALKDKHILVAEDLELNQDLVRHLLRGWGCRVSFASNGLRAVELAQSEPYDLILMDIQMPEMDGIEATRRIRALPDASRAAVPIIALTANSEEGYRRRYIAAGMNDCLLKPYGEQALRNLLMKYLQNESLTPYMSSISSTEAVQISENEALYSLSSIEELSGGDQAFVDRMMQLFLNVVPPTLEEMQMAVGEQRWMDLSKLAHKLKATIDTMRVSAIRQTIRKIEEEGRKGTPSMDLGPLVEEVSRVLREVVADIRSKQA